MNKFLRNVGFYLLIILIAISVIDYFSTRNTTKQEINYTEFLQQVDKGEVSKVTIVDNVIKGTLADGTEFTTITPNSPNGDGNLIKSLQDKHAFAGLDVRLVSLAEFGSLPDAAEDGKTFGENARSKAEFYREQTGCACLADDSGLCIDVLAGAPGVYSARFAGHHGQLPDVMLIITV